ncbi:globoside alpha-1,3-N-acetylgalactosaminyltransferase 1 isoform X3 [Symphalangus syndactylus]|nr:globoside alpha-1,3-N-acetylgalactosaminyltransferase 1 isoform X3 [Symphalangus syndactylus]
MKLHYKREKPLQPVVWSQYPQPKLLEHRWIIVPSSLEAGGADERGESHCPRPPCCQAHTAADTHTLVGAHRLRGNLQPRASAAHLPATEPDHWGHGVCRGESFLESAEEFFMRGYRVHYYIFTDNPAAVPGVPLGPHRLLSTIPFQGHSQWEETSMRQTETISQHIAKRAHREVDYVFCLDVDMMFQNPWGPETLGDLVAAIHPSYYAVPRQQFPYERRRVSTAFVADSEGDFYYGGAVFGGQVARVYEFTRGCHMAILADKANGIMAAWREESHLNRRFISNKPSKVLSPEYLWDDRKPQPPSLKLIRFSTLDKDISCLRS